MHLQDKLNISFYICYVLTNSIAGRFICWLSKMHEKHIKLPVFLLNLVLITCKIKKYIYKQDFMKCTQANFVEHKYAFG